MLEIKLACQLKFQEITCDYFELYQNNFYFYASNKITAEFYTSPINLSNSLIEKPPGVVSNLWILPSS